MISAATATATEINKAALGTGETSEVTWRDVLNVGTAAPDSVESDAEPEPLEQIKAVNA